MRARERIEAGEALVLATVIWRRAPSSGKEGDRALIGADGRVEGWLGGACAEPAVVREALDALRDGRPRLMFLGPAEDLEERRREGVIAVPIACQSEGALEVHLEPLRPAPHLVAVGRSPAVATLVRLATELGWRASARDDPDLSGVGVGEGSCVVVATQGHYDEAALEAALATPAAYVGLVASRRRAESVLGYLRQRGLPDEAVARVRAPAGLDLGRIAHEEIAVAVLAELVRLRAAGELRPAALPGAAPETAVDPICGMTVDVATSRHRLESDEGTVHFCGAGCLAAYRERVAGR
jgi:xanthine dehydrogenase accessory factor